MRCRFGLGVSLLLTEDTLWPTHVYPSSILAYKAGGLGLLDKKDLDIIA